MESWETDPDVRERLVRLLDALDASGQSILTCTSRVIAGRPQRSWFVVRDMEDEEIVRFPADDAERSDPRAWISELLSVACVSCGERLLENEIGMCGLCEAEQIMGLLRLRTDFR